MKFLAVKKYVVKDPNNDKRAHCFI